MKSQPHLVIKHPIVGYGLFAAFAAFRVCLSGLLFCFLIGTSLLAQDTPDYFRQNCMNCHTIGGGRLNGPDLKDVHKRRDAEWLITFMMNPRAAYEGGDPDVVQLVEQFNKTIMPTAPGMNRYRAEQLLKLIEEESAKEKSQFQGVQISSRPFTEKDRIAGQELFLGVTKFKKGGTACNACHTMHDLPQLGGGKLGPDLTRVYERQKGRKALSAWLMAPATETMQPIFKDHPLEAEEIHQLVAYFADSAEHTEADSSVSRISFLLMGLITAALLIFLFDRIWKGRFQAVRQPLVEERRRAVLGQTSEEMQPVGNSES